MGRIVIYHHPGSADGTYPAQDSPAIVQHVNDDGSSFLWVFGRYGVQFQPSSAEGTGPCQWSWPARV
jgi:hypothetical protein